jgi:1-acyl-sn-glycerol-3-phosphate acyltransferase
VIRTVWVLLAGVVSTLVFSIAVWLPVVVRHPRAPEGCERLGRRWARSLLWLAGVRVRFEGPERAEWPDRAVIVANHQSWFDVFALATELPVTYRFVAKEELSRIPIFAQAWKGCGHISLPRSDSGRAIQSLNQAGRQVRDGKSAIVLFPEGTRSPDGRLRKFKKGAFVLAINNGVPVIPVAISGSRAVMPKGSFRIRPGEIRIRVGDPIPTEGLKPRDRDDLLRRSRAVVASLMEDPDALAQGESQLNDEEGQENHVDAKEITG